jgi:hypothetical protein
VLIASGQLSAPDHKQGSSLITIVAQFSQQASGIVRYSPLFAIIRYYLLLLAIIPAQASVSTVG